MIDHITIRVQDLEKSRTFYEKALAVLGHKHNIGNSEEGYYGFGIGEDPVLEITQATAERPAHTKIHFAFKASGKEQVDEFYRRSTCFVDYDENYEIGCVEQ